ncbi:MAG: virulence factor [Candidatus Nanopelagicales bacterium]
MSEYQITSWRQIPAMVTARDGDDVAKISLPSRFQEAIDEAAMRLGDTGADAYLAGWQRGSWLPGESGPAQTPADLAAIVAASLEDEWSSERIADFLAVLNST